MCESGASVNYGGDSGGYHDGHSADVLGQGFGTLETSFGEGGWVRGGIGFQVVDGVLWMWQEDSMREVAVQLVYQTQDSSKGMMPWQSIYALRSFSQRSQGHGLVGVWLLT